MAASLASLSRRGAAVEEGWAKKEQELLAAALRERLEASPAGRARLAAHGAPPQQTHSMLPAIARQYLRLDTPQQARDARPVVAWRPASCGGLPCEGTPWPAHRLTRLARARADGAQLNDQPQRLPPQEPLHRGCAPPAGLDARCGRWGFACASCTPLTPRLPVRRRRRVLR